MTDSPWEFFSLEELRCKCGECKSTGGEMNPDFMQKIVALRKTLGFPFIVASAYRCGLHNAQVSGTGTKGPHTTGKAMDISIRGEQAWLLLQAAYDHGISGVGVSQKGLSRFIHLDDCDDSDGLPRPMVWSY